MFAAASFAAAKGILTGWSATTFRSYYLFGAILNVPVLALGTIYLLGPRRLGNASAVVVAAGGLFAAGAALSAHLNKSALRVVHAIPAGRSVMPAFVQSLSKVYSIIGFVIVVSGAVWSSWRLASKPQEHLRRLAKGNILIAAGTTVVAVASGFAKHGNGAIFSIGLLAGVCVMFAGFLVTRSAGGRAGKPVASGDQSNTIS